LPAKRALITGITGQDGSYLAERLLAQDYVVYGLARQSSSGRNLSNLQPAMRAWGDRLHLLAGDMLDSATVRSAVQDSRPHEVYNLAAQSFVADSWKMATYTMEVNAMGFVHLLEAVADLDPSIRVYQASTSEMFGNVSASGMLNEESQMRPRSPYGAAKLAAHRMAAVYRESYNLFIACGICFNHESPRRGEMFVTRKIARGVAEIKLNMRDVIALGDLSPHRDWGFAGDYVVAMHQMLQADEPADYVIATGESHAVRDYLLAALEVAGLPPDIERYVWHDKALLRPAEIFKLRGDSSRIRHTLGWTPAMSFGTLVEVMVETEIERARLRKRA
jgi:GDPmannose 4,6-dehydratase